MRDNVTSAGNQQGSRFLRKLDPSETTRRTPSELRAYLLGALHDATYSRRHRTHRLAQRDARWLIRLQQSFTALGIRSWIYREGRNRDVSVLETSAKFLALDFDPGTLQRREDVIAYIRGFFDAEGGVPRTTAVRFYIQLAVKDRSKLEWIWNALHGLDISCGTIHNPSRRVDPDYFRCYVLAASRPDFARIIGSWHPRKQHILGARVKI